MLVQNMRQQVTDAKQISKDDTYNLLQVAYHLPETIWRVTCVLMSGVVGMKEIMDELNQLLDTKSGESWVMTPPSNLVTSEFLF